MIVRDALLRGRISMRGNKDCERYIYTVLRVAKIVITGEGAD